MSQRERAELGESQRGAIPRCEKSWQGDSHVKNKTAGGGLPSGCKEGGGQRDPHAHKGEPVGKPGCGMSQRMRGKRVLFI